MNIAIKLPNNLKELIATFPFLHKLKSCVQREDNVHLISACDEIEVLNLLPLKAFYHKLSPRDYKGISGAYRSSKTAITKGARFDYYFSLTKEKEDAFLGFFLRAKKRIGFDDANSSFLFHEKVHYLKGRTLSEASFPLLKTLFTIDENEIENYGSRSLMVEKEHGFYIAVDARLLEDKEWFEFLSLFQKERIFIIGKSEVYKSYATKNFIEIGKIIYNSEAFISADETLVDIAAYCGVPSFYLHEAKNITSMSHVNFLGKVFYINTSSPEYQDGESLHYGHIFDYIWKKCPKVVKE